MMTDTQELLANFVRNGSESAFRELVTRYLDLVYSTAVRLVDGDTHRAEDVSQIVFADMARMAGKLSSNTMLGGWLHKHTCFVARTVMRGERRRQARERHAAEMNALNAQTDGVLKQIAPILDEAIQELGPDDRDAILLRFFERRNLRSVGEALGTTENVAQRRVSRAVQELGISLRRRGVTLSAAALASSLVAGAVTTAPAALALSISGTVLAGVGLGASTGVTSTKLAAITKIELGIAATVLVGFATALFLHNQSKASLSHESGLAQQQSVSSESAERRVSTPANREIVRSFENGPPQAQIEASQFVRSNVDVIRQPTKQLVAVPEKSVVNNPIPLRQRLNARSGSRLRIEGTSNIHDWQAESKIIAGFLDVGPDFPLKKDQVFRLAACRPYKFILTAES